MIEQYNFIQIADDAPELPEQLGTAWNNAFDVFVGYLLLNAWFANQDRHHENWGVINHNDAIYLAPTFDHAASMGQHETDSVRKNRLNTKDPSYKIECYAERARSVIYLFNKDRIKAAIDVFDKSAVRSPKSARLWRQIPGDISKQQWVG